MNSLTRFLRNVLRFLATSALFCTVCSGVYVTNACRLRALSGERVFYLGSASSQGVRKTELRFSDYARITGESVRFARGEGKAEEIARGIAGKYGATILFCEEAAGVLSYYGYTDTWKNGVCVGGEYVNLHIAVSETQCAVGTPIIFDGF